MNIDELVDRFLAWPLPDSVCSDSCVTEQNYGKAQGWPKRVGTNLLTADEAKQMIEYLLSQPAQPPASEAVAMADAWKGRADDAGRLSRAVLALRADGGAKVPEGWKLVPVKPTASMLLAASRTLALDAMWPGISEAARKYYTAMLAAAPSPEGNEASSPLDASLSSVKPS